MKRRITLSLISHTNVGKTTLARTLLRRDVGQVRDQAHVTDVSEAHTLIETGEAILQLWDTPGFGDTRRLLHRLEHEHDPLGWFLHQVWDRFLDRPLWCSQQAMANVREHADVVLYLINASEDPEGAGYVPMELKILSWMDRPVLLLLNQVGEDEDDLETEWRTFGKNHPVVRDVLSLDAFTRCWLEESLLLERVVPLLDGHAADTMRDLLHAWDERNLSVFHDAMSATAAYLASTSVDRETPGSGKKDPERRTARRLVDALKFDTVDRRAATGRLNERLDRRTAELMGHLIASHGLEGRSASTIEERVREFQVQRGSAFDETSGAVAGAVVSGALGGLAADVLSGGLSLGGGMIAGGILGALGGTALAKGYRFVGGDKRPSVSWAPGFLDELTRQALLRYMAVAHFGRGGGEYHDRELPEHWSERVEQALEPRLGTLHETWSAAAKDGVEESALAQQLQPILGEVLMQILIETYPGRAP